MAQVPAFLVTPWVLVAAICWLPSFTSELAEEDLTASELLDRMARVYADCASYRDAGVVKTVFISARGKRTTERPFRTAFIRPDRFRFEFTAQKGIGESRYIVWRSGDDVRKWWDVRPGVVQGVSLEMALTGAAGVSGRSAHTVPALLLPSEVAGRRLTAVEGAERAEDAQHDGVDCFRITGTFGGSPITVWLAQSTFLIRRIDIQNEFDDFRTEGTTTYEAVVNEDLPEGALEFDPPQAK